jgi:hypothetical protein
MHFVMFRHPYFWAHGFACLPHIDQPGWEDAPRQLLKDGGLHAVVPAINKSLGWVEGVTAVYV